MLRVLICLLCDILLLPKGLRKIPEKFFRAK
jgi:hypothetical protein